MTQCWLSSSLFVCLLLASTLKAARIPFGSRSVTYTSDHITPSSASASVISTLYSYWSTTYLRSLCVGNGAFLRADDRLEGTSSVFFSSETGRGMIAAAIMDDQTTFNKFYTGYESFMVC